MEKVQFILALLAQTKPESEVSSSIAQLILKTLTRILERDLAALLFGAACMLVLLIKYWNVPKKWESTHERLIRIEKRQKKFYPLFLQHLGASKYIDHDDFDDPDSDDDSE